MDILTHIAAFDNYLRFERHYSDHTRNAYLSDILQFQQYLALHYEMTTVDLVKKDHLRSWMVTLKQLPLRERSLQRKMSSIKSFFNYLCRQEVLKQNPAMHIPLPKPPKRLPVFLEAEQTAILVNDVRFAEGFEGHTERLIIELLYQPGIRRQELVQLKEADVEFSRKQLRVLGKGNKERLVPLDDKLLAEIQDYIQEKRKTLSENGKFLLSLKSGKQIYPQYVYRVVKKYLSNITTLNKKSPHVMRHTFATQLLNNGAELNAIKELLGHSSLAATQVYTHNNIERLKEQYRKAHPKS